MMTNNEKEMIRELRMQGLGYGKVAERMGLNLETVKSFCRRHDLRGEGKTLAGLPDAKFKYVYCKNCGRILQLFTYLIIYSISVTVFLNPAYYLSVEKDTY